MEGSSNKVYPGHPDQRWGPTSYAQHADDFMLINLFSLIGIEKPSYLDVGAHHPETISNTKLLYDRGSRGVNVEANPNLIAEFNRLRPEDKNLNVGVGVVVGKRTFYMYDDSSGRNTFCFSEMLGLKGLLEVQCEMVLEMVTLDSILKAHCGGRWPDLLCMDIEGLDFEVLDSADFGVDNRPKIICVEVRRQDTYKFRDMMIWRDYFLYCRMGENLFFIDQQFRKSVY